MSRFISIQSLIVLLVSTLMVAVGAPAQTTWHVDDNASLGGDGTTWPAAFKYLQDALEAAVSGDEIRVAGGTYKPDQDEDDPNTATPGDREAAFQLVNGVGLYGGYAGLADPNNPDARDIQLYETILSGDLNGDDQPGFVNNDENSYHVVTGSGTNERAVLDGFTVSAGNADGVGSPDYAGGGMLNENGTPTIENCTFSGNSADRGGGMYNSQSSPMLINCMFNGNSADYGGGMYNSQSSPTLTTCTFSGNSVSYYGAGMHNWYGSPTLANCTFSGNAADRDGGGMCNQYESSPTVVNCTFSGNSAGYGGGVGNRTNSSPTLANCTFSGNSASGGGAMGSKYNSSPTVVNCILWHDIPDEIRNDASTTTASYSDVQGGWPGTGNIDADPLFVDPNNADYHLQSGSPCVDAADNTGVPPDAADLDGDGDTTEPTPVDLDRRLRFADRIATPDTGNPDPNFPELEIVDMGTFEYQCSGDLDGDGDIDLSDLSQMLANYGRTDSAVYEDGDLDLDRDVDLSDLAALLGVYGTTCD